MTLDGYIADEQGGVGFLDSINDCGDDFGYQRFFDSVDSVVMGAKTYEQILSFGEYPYSTKKSFVFTNRKEELLARTTFQDDLENPIQFLSGDIKERIEELRGKNSYETLWLVGGGHLIKQMIEEKLLDELILFIVPMLLGTGVPMFEQIKTDGLFSLLSVKEYSKGTLELRYNLK
jgi:dihydrofolate reductase